MLLMRKPISKFAAWVAIDVEKKMKRLITVVALATLVAAPAFAASPKHASQHRTTASEAYASVQDPYAVVVDGQVVGRDPDPSIRMQLSKDAYLSSAGE